MTATVVDDTPVDAPVPAVSWVRRSLPLLLAAVIVLLGLVFTGGWVAADHLGRGAPGENSVDVGFSRDMATHHLQAVDMSLELLADQGTSRAVRTVAYDIATSQQEQIGRMHAFLDSWGRSVTGDRPEMSWMTSADMAGMTGMTHLQANGLMPGMATQAELTRLTTLRGEAADVDYLQLMIRHHLGGLDMATYAASKADNKQVRLLAQNIVGGQTSDLVYMRKLLTADGAKELPAT